MDRTYQGDKFHIGACYYPEHWPEPMWEEDMRRMRAHGLDTIRIAEFAWTIFEPEEDRFEFEMFDKVLDLAHQYGIKVVMGTPTAAPPAWLSEKYPEVLNADQQGHEYRHGERRHYSYNSEVYRERSARIVREMALHYRNHPAVMGWQIDNEFNCHVSVFYADADHEAFREWLQARYGTLLQLNEAWGTVFWSQTYTSWSQVRLTSYGPLRSPNPHQALDEKRFISHSVISYCKLQYDILRECAPNHWVTTNGVFDHIDSHELTDRSLDFFSYDSYPNFHQYRPDEGPKPLLDRMWSWHLSRIRSISPNYAIMEQQSGSGGWTNDWLLPAPLPGQMRLWTFQSIAHGADLILYFRWRTAAFGTEMYWQGLNDYHSGSNDRLEELKRITGELAGIGDHLLGSRVQSPAAICRDYDNEWDGELDQWHGPFTERSTRAWLNALHQKHIPYDAMYIRESTTVEQLSAYEVLVYPHPAIVSERTAELLTSYVEQGGTLIIGCRAGYKDERGQCRMTVMPGPLSKLCGATVEHFNRIGALQVTPSLVMTGVNGDEVMLEAELFNDVLSPILPDAETLAVYSSGSYKGKAGLIRNKLGLGTVYYYGAVFNESSAGQLLELAGVSSPSDGWASLPEPVELVIRRHPESGEEYRFLLNYSDEEQEIELQEPCIDRLSGRMLVSAEMIQPYDVWVLQMI